MALRALATVDLGAVRRNARRLADRAAPARLCAVVKADGYGHGAVPVARAVLQGGASWLAVATAAEAAELREALGTGPRILLMGALSREELPVALGAEADVVAWTEAFVATLPAGTRVHVKLDTGMGRLGTRSAEEAINLATGVARDPRLQLAGAMTHLATADGDPGFMAGQLERFRPFAAAVRALAPGALAHAANSAGTLRDGGAGLDLVRCGIALYGLDPFGGDPARHDLEPALSLRSYLAAVKRAEPGDSAGYGRAWFADAPTWVGTVPIGYADGVRRGLHPGGAVLIAGRRYPLAGTISMDNLTVDLGPELAPEVMVGAPVTLIGDDGTERIGAEDLAERLGTINYEIVCGISHRVPREYRQ